MSDTIKNFPLNLSPVSFHYSVYMYVLCYTGPPALLTVSFFYFVHSGPPNFVSSEIPVHITIGFFLLQIENFTQLAH
jgi:hypothetical protein